MKLIIFTDLDGTLLDADTYTFDAALPALQLIREYDIPLVICSSKTKKEIEYYREKLINHHPFISENGGGIFIPDGYFDLPQESHLAITRESGYRVIRLGTPYPELRRTLKELQTEGYRIKGFGDLEPEEIARIAHMTLTEAEMARERDFDEPFIVLDSSLDVNDLLETIERKGLHWTQGHFLHLTGDNDKGRAVSYLIEFYREKFGDVRTAAAGDSPNDIPMLERVDHAVIVQKRDGSYDSKISLPQVICADGRGPEGWNNALIQVIKGLHT